MPLPRQLSCSGGIIQKVFGVTILLMRLNACIQAVPIADPRAFIEQDAVPPRGEAERLLAEGDKLRATGKAEARRTAIEKYKASLLLWQSLGERSKESAALHGLCSTHNALGEKQIALGYCEQALVIRRKIDDQRGEAETLNVAGNIQLALQGPRQALDYFQRSLALRRALGEQRGIAVTLGNLSRLYAQLGDSEKELEALREALPLSQSVGDKALENSLLNMSGVAHNRIGEVETALNYFRRSLDLSRERHDRGNEAATLSNLGKLYYETGEKQQALTLLTDARALHHLNGDRLAEGATLTTLAGLWRSMGEADKALLIGEEALKLTREPGGNDYELFALQTLGGIHSTLRDNRKALEYDQAALSLARTRGSKSREAIMLSRVAIDWMRLNDLPKALEYHQQAIALHRETGEQIQLIFTLLELCGTQIKLGNHTDAAAACHESLDLSRNRKDRESQANALWQLAKIAGHKDDWARAHTLLEEALELVEATGSEIMSADARASYLGFKYELYNDYIEVLMIQHRSDTSAGFDGQALQTVERARARALLALLTEAQADIRQGVDSALLERERWLLKRLETKAMEQRRLGGDSANQHKLSAIEREISEFSDELEKVRAQIRTGSPRYAALTQPQPLTVHEIQDAVLDADTLLLEYALGEEQSFLFAITDKTFNSYILPKREVIEKAARRFYELLTARNRKIKFEEAARRAERLRQADKDLTAAGVELSEMILQPIAAELRQRRLLIVADGALQLIPFATLPVSKSKGTESEKTRRPASLRPPALLVVNHEVVHLPSASTLAVLRRELKDRNPAPKMVAVLADPVFEADDERVPKEVRERLARERQAAPPNEKSAAASDELTRAVQSARLDGERSHLARLPYTRAEAQAILALTPQPQSFGAFDFAASQSTALDQSLGQYRYVHFATHGLLNDTHPELSGLVLSLIDRQGRSQDGFLRIIEVFNLKLPAELVVLSGCKTGLGKQIRGEGLVGLTRGFMYAGAARVLVSLWDVNDRATAELMMRAYRGMLNKGLRPAEALRAAQLELSRQPQWRAPYYWASFVLMGEPR